MSIGLLLLGCLDVGASHSLPRTYIQWLLCQFLQGSRIVNLQRQDKDPDPILLSYIPALDLVKQMFADVKNKKGFVLKPQVSSTDIA